MVDACGTLGRGPRMKREIYHLTLEIANNNDMLYKMRLIDTDEILKRTGISRARFRDWIRRGKLPRPARREYLGQGLGSRCYYGASVVDRIDWILQERKKGKPISSVPDFPKSPSPSKTQPVERSTERPTQNPTLEQLVVLIHKRHPDHHRDEIRRWLDVFLAANRSTPVGWEIEEKSPGQLTCHFPDNLASDGFLSLFDLLLSAKARGVHLHELLGWYQMHRAKYVLEDTRCGVELAAGLQDDETKELVANTHVHHRGGELRAAVALLTEEENRLPTQLRNQVPPLGPHPRPSRELEAG